jgi:hypothetical protein
MKPFWKSTTCISAIAGIAISFSAGGSPLVGKIIARQYPEQKEAIQEWVDLVAYTGALLGTATGMGVIVGRFNAKEQVSSPDWLPGPNQPRSVNEVVSSAASEIIVSAIGMIFEPEQE